MQRQVSLILLAVILAGAGRTLGQAGNFGRDDFDRDLMKVGTEANPRPERKSPSLFLRPSKATPAEQLAYADSLVEGGAMRKAGKAYNALVHKWHDSAEAPTAQYRYARILDDDGSYQKAFQELQYLMEYYPAQFPFEESIELQFRIANHLAEQGRFFFIGPSGESKALPLFQRIVVNAPKWKRTPEAYLRIGAIQENREEFDLAAATYERLLDTLPPREIAETAALRRALCLMRQIPTPIRNQESMEQALSALAAFLRDYPGSREAPAAREELTALKAKAAQLAYEQPVFYDSIAHRPESALIAYNDFIKRFPTSPLARQATERAEEIRASARR